MAKRRKKPTWFLVPVAVYGFFAMAAGQKIYLQRMERKTATEDKIVLSDQTPRWVPSPHTRLSHHDSQIEKVSETHQIDWRLTAALISVESSFNARAKSKAGAIGLMQVMPAVYREQKTPVEYHPEINMNVGLTHFKNLYGRIRADTVHDRMLMAFAAYNAGIGHLYDAQRIAKAKKLNPYVWQDLAKVYPMLETAYVYKSMPHGYCQGRSVVAYVKKVARQYEQFQKIYPINRTNLTRNTHAEPGESTSS